MVLVSDLPQTSASRLHCDRSSDYWKIDRTEEQIVPGCAERRLQTG